MGRIVFNTNSAYPTSVKFSPFLANRLSCTTAENFGLFGRGSLFFLESTSARVVRVLSRAVWPDALLDVTWSESEPNVALTSAGDGTAQLWNCNDAQVPLCIYRGHDKEVSSVQWNQTRSGDFFLTGSWDKTVKLWDVHRVDAIRAFNGHLQFVYDAVWSPLMRDCFVSASGDGFVRLWNINGDMQPLLAFCAQTQTEILSCDWSKYNQNIVATGSSDSVIRVWDIRNTNLPAFELFGHRYAVRRVRFSPHHENVLFSCSYDFTTRVWRGQTTCQVYDHHTEFVYGLDPNTHTPNEVSDCSWDRSIHIFHCIND